MRTRGMQFAVLFGLLFAAAGMAREAAGAGPRERDVWYVYVADGQRYGSEHVRVSCQDDGNFCYRVESRLLVSVLGQSQEIKVNAEYVVTPRYEPVSLEYEESGLSGTARTQGRIEQGRLLLQYERDQVRRTGSLDLSTRPLFDACFSDWLADQPAEATNLERQVVSELSLDLRAASALREKGEGDDAVWHVSLGGDLGYGRLVLDRDGIRREMDLRAPRLHSIGATEKEAQDLHHRTLESREMLMFPASKPVGMPERLTSLTVRISWKDIPLERFNLTDERQQIVEHAEESGCHSVLLRIRPISPTADGAANSLPPAVSQPCLAETRFIKPQDPDIRQQAQAWVGDAGIGLEALRKLCTGVFQHLQGGTLIAETLSGPEVLHTRKGKCSEYAILFASAARSLGIPTRIVLGMRMISGSWVGHMWNEAHVEGRWITVDAAADEVGGTPALLKLTHSDRVLGTQSLRWEVTDSLEVAIEDCEPRPQIADVKTGIDGPTYTNAEQACRLTAPEPSWTLEDVSKPGLPVSVIRFKVPQHDDLWIHFVALTAPPMFTPPMLVQLRNVQFKAKYQAFEVLRDEDYRVGTLAGRIFAFRRAKSKDAPQPVKTTEVLWTDGTSTYLLNLIAAEPDHDQYAADFFKLLKSFESLRTPNAPR